MHRSHGPIVLLAALAACAAMFGQAPVARAGADTIVVTTTEDELNTDGDCSLREAVVAANTNAAVDACPPGAPGNDTIELASGATYPLSIPGAGEDAAATGDLDILEPVEILVDVQADPATIDGGGLDRIFDVGPDVVGVSLRLLVLRNGDAGDESGGAVRFHDACRAINTDFLTGTIVSDSLAASGGAVWIGACRDVEVSGASLVGNAASDEGGAIWTAGALTFVQNSTLSGNSAGGSGGAMWAAEGSSVSILYATIANNDAPAGGALSAPANSVTLNSSIIADNTVAACAVAALAGDFAISDDATCPTALTASDVGLEPLTSVTGYPVHQLGLTSPARDVDARTICAIELTFDQVNTRRPQDGDGDGVAACDAGAIEAPAVPPVKPGPAPAPLPDTATLEATGARTASALAGAVAVTVIGVGLGWRLGWSRRRRR